MPPVSVPVPVPPSVPVPVSVLEAGVGGGVHDGGEGFELFGGGEDFQVVQAAAGFADECSLAVAEFFLAGFGSVLVDGVDPAFGHPVHEVGVALLGGAGQ